MLVRAYEPFISPPYSTRTVLFVHTPHAPLMPGTSHQSEGTVSDYLYTQDTNGHLNQIGILGDLRCICSSFPTTSIRAAPSYFHKDFQVPIDPGVRTVRPTIATKLTLWILPRIVFKQRAAIPTSIGVKEGFHILNSVLRVHPSMRFSSTYPSQ
jgi:hypothetical protein